MHSSDVLDPALQDASALAAWEADSAEWPVIRQWLIRNAELLRADESLLSGLGLKAVPENLVEFGPAALAKLERVAKRERKARRLIEQTAVANFKAQAEAHAAVLDLLESRNHTDLARRLDHAAKTRFGLVRAVIALEGTGSVPMGWNTLEDGGVDYILGDMTLARLGPDVVCTALFDEDARHIQSAAAIRLCLWRDQRPAIAAFGSSDPDGFTPEMGAELVAFLARVVERTAERWPVL